MSQFNSFVSEALSAARGVGGLIVGDRRLRDRFSLGARGLVGSFAALLLVMAAGALVPMALGEKGFVFRMVVVFATTFVLQVGCGLVALWQAGRLDGFVPYLVADNWASVYVTLASLILGLVGVPNEVIGFPIGVLIVIIAVNIGRLVVGLMPLQVAMFTVAQVVGYLLCGLLIPYIAPVATAVSN